MGRKSLHAVCSNFCKINELGARVHWIRTFSIIHQNSENLFSFSAWFNFSNWWMRHFATNLMFSRNYCYSYQMSNATSCWITLKTIANNHPLSCITSLASTIGQWLQLPRIPIPALYGSISDRLRGLARCQGAFSVLWFTIVIENFHYFAIYSDGVTAFKFCPVFSNSDEARGRMAKWMLLLIC